MFEPRPTPEASTAPPREPAKRTIPRGGWWAGLAALVAVACCSPPTTVGGWCVRRARRDRCRWLGRWPSRDRRADRGRRSVGPAPAFV